MADQNDIDFKNNTAQWDAINVALQADVAAHLEEVRKLRGSSLQGSGTQQLYAEAMKRLTDAQAKAAAHGATKQGAAGRGDPVAAARQANRAGVGAETYTPNPKAVAAAAFQNTSGSDYDPVARALAFIKRATPFLGKEGGYYNTAMTASTPFDGTTLQNIMDPDTFNARVAGDSQLAVAPMGAQAGDVSLGLTAGQQARPLIQAQRDNEAAGLRTYNADSTRHGLYEDIAGGIELGGRRAIQGGTSVAGLGLAATGASAAVSKLAGDPSWDLMGQAAYKLFPDSPTLKSVFSTDEFADYRQKLDAQEKLDARLFQGAYGYDRKTAGARPDVDEDGVAGLVGNNRKQLFNSIMSTLTKKQGPKGPMSQDAIYQDLKGGFAELDELIEAAALAGKTGKMPKALQERIKQNKAWQYATAANPKSVIYGTDRTAPNAGERGNVYALGMDDEGKNLSFARQGGSRDQLFQAIEMANE